MTGREVPRSIEFRAVIDEPTGYALAEIFREYWPAYKRWMLKASSTPARDYQARLRSFMPELVPVYERLIESFDGEEPDAVARFLSLYNPPRVVRGCSQLVLDTDDGPLLLRSYDHHPAMIDGLIVKSTWNDRAVIAMSDCIWGALDGINQDGLAISLAFGGRDVVGPGFAAPLITRYILETCATVSEARAALARVPVYMPYTFLVVDASGDFITAYTGPDAPSRFVERRASTNHQSTEDWPEYRRFTQSVERLTMLESMINETEQHPPAIDCFLRPPLWRRNYAQASGTLYIAEYRPANRTLSLHWPARQERFGLDTFVEREITVPLG